MNTLSSQSSFASGSSGFTPKRGFRAWVITLWPLVLHCVVATCIMTFMICYVNGRHFNLTERRPWVPLAAKLTLRLSGYVPLQSDITTLLSSTLVTLRLIATTWAGSLCWRGAFVLMETAGLRPRDLDWMISYGVFTPLTYGRHVRIFCVGVILLVTLSAQAASPLLTGSITWTPSSRLVELGSNAGATVGVSVVSNSDLWRRYSGFAPRRKWTAQQAAGLASLAWGRKIEKDALKRVLPSISGLNTNSTITNVTVPYFSVAALEWISDPEATFSPDQLNISSIVANLSTFEGIESIQWGAGILIPDSPWNTTFPSPSTVSETRTLILATHQLEEGSACEKNNSGIFQFSPSIGFIQRGQTCYAFARVTYRAGAGLCVNCRASSYITVQNDTEVVLQEDRMTIEALRLMPDVISLLVLMNSSIPCTWEHLDDYVIGVLGRSYSGAWTALTNYVGGTSEPLSSGFTASLPSLQARVDLKRVYAWLAIQHLVTLSGTLFLLMQSGTKYRLIGNTTLAAFKLDTTDVTTEAGSNQLKDGGVLRLEEKAAGLKVVVKS